MSVDYPVNPFTQMIDAVARRNAEGGGSGISTGDPRPSVSSAAVGRFTEVDNQPMSAEERYRLDQLARAAGVQDERIGGDMDFDVGGAEQDQYANMSLDDVIAQGAPVSPAKSIAGTGRLDTTRSNIVGPPSARVVKQEVVRLPDFTRVQGIDLLRGVCYVDDMEFTIPTQDSQDFRRYVVTVARNEILAKLQSALGSFAEGTDGGDSTK